MAGNPRKFSEKIAIQQRKLMEEQNAFESIMADVSTITKGDPAPEGLNLCPPCGWPRPGGSLPNFSHLSHQPHMMPPTGEMAAYPEHWTGHTCMAGGVETTKPVTIEARDRSSGAVVHGYHSHGYHPYRHAHSSTQAANARAISSCRHTMPDDESQFPQQFLGAHGYLAPPQDTSWRRAHSDPGLHASVTNPAAVGVQSNSSSPGGPSPGSTSPNAGFIGEMSHDALQSSCYLDPKATMGAGCTRPRSCDTVPHVPNINIQPSDPLVGTQMSISSCTGSLPDLPSSLLPSQIQGHQAEGLSGSAAPPSYQQSSTFTRATGQTTASASASSPVANPLQQRHSVNFPLQCPPQGAVGGVPKYAYHNTGTDRRQNSAYPPTSHSVSRNPNEITQFSVTSTQSMQPQSSGSMYTTIQNQMQNINIVDHQPFVGQQCGYYSGNEMGSCYSSLPTSSTADQQFPIASSAQIRPSQQEQMYQTLMQQQHQQQQQQQQYQAEVPLSPQGQIPNIIFTGTDGYVQGGAASRDINGDGLFLDQAVELLSSDLRMSLDPIDLETLHGLAMEQGLNIDPASEDELRRDRV